MLYTTDMELPAVKDAMNSLGFKTGAEKTYGTSNVRIEYVRSGSKVVVRNRPSPAPHTAVYLDGSLSDRLFRKLEKALDLRDYAARA